MSKKITGRCPGCSVTFNAAGKAEVSNHLKKQHNYKGAKLKQALKTLKEGEA